MPAEPRKCLGWPRSPRKGLRAASTRGSVGRQRVAEPQKAVQWLQKRPFRGHVSRGTLFGR